MFFARTKKYLGLLLALSIVFGILIFNPEDVKADSGIELDKVYTVTEDDYRYQLDDYCAAYKFVPSRSGYYLLSSNLTLDAYYFEDGSSTSGVIPSGYKKLENEIDFSYFNLQDMFDPDMQEVYYLKEGKAYFFEHSTYGSYDIDTGFFCLRQIDEYVSVTPHSDPYAARDGSFKCWIEINSTVNLSNYTCNWYSFSKGVLESDDADISSITLNSNDYFSEDDFTYGTTLYDIYCSVTFECNEQNFSYWFYDFRVKPCENELAKYVWAEPVGEMYVYVPNYEFAGKYFTVNATTSVPDTAISYEWYMSNDYGDTYELIPGKTGNQISVADLGDPVIEYSSYDADYWYYQFTPVRCEVTFDNGKEVVTKSVSFEASYGIENDFAGSKAVTANYGDTITFPVNGGFEEKLKSSGITYEYNWYGFTPCDDGWAWLDLGTDKTVTVDTSLLPVYHGEYGDYSEFYCICNPILDGRTYSGDGILYTEFVIYYTDLLIPDTTGIAVNSENFPDMKFRQYVSDNFDTDKSGYLTKPEIEAVTFIDVLDMGITNLEGIRYFGNLQRLYCGRNVTHALDLSGLGNLIELRADMMGLETLNLSGCYNLRIAYLNINLLDSINLDDCPYLMQAYTKGPQTTTMASKKFYGLYVTDSYANYELIYGLEMDEETVVEGAEPFTLDDTDLKITKEPHDFEGAAGDTAVFNIAVNKEDVEYKWQYMLDDSNTWIDCTDEGYNTDTLIIPVVKELNGVRYRCLVTDGTYTVQTGFVKIFVLTYIPIYEQPVDYIGLEGSTAKFNVDADGEGITYQWQLKKGKTWANLTSGGATTQTLSVKVDASKNGKVYRCLITDEYGRTVTTNEVSITVKEPSIKINTQPKDYKGIEGSTAKFTVDAEGEGLTYQWQLKKGKNWANLTSGGATTSTMSIKVDASKNGKIYRCLITNADGEELATNEVSITVKEPSITITSQPSNYVGTAGITARFSVAAEGEGLTYQWQLKKGKSWANLSSGGATTSTMSINVDESKNGKVYRCLITNADGEELASNEVSITIKQPAIKIIKQPRTAYGDLGATIKFSVEAEGEGLTYQWQLQKGKSWADLTSGGATTNELTVKFKIGSLSKVYRCVITNSDGEKIATNEVTIDMFYNDPNYLSQQHGGTSTSSDHDEEKPIVAPVTPANSVEQLPPESSDDSAKTVETAETVESVVAPSAEAPSEAPPAEAPVEAPAPAPVEPEAVPDAAEADA